ncbi:hypothetical protein GCM10009836_11410 [Pseudonocardia ailaonensis]|uniref:DUF3040 domain-containing protein n=1 Tax=Pseudonocardia ailaonensis TaxID=367279 RepID=A0ABN2MQ16_9PSEU
MSVPESRPPRLTEAERQQLDALEQQLRGQYPDLDGRFRAARHDSAPPLERRIARIVFAVLAVAMIAVAAVVGGLGGAAAVAVAVAGTAGILMLVNHTASRARAVVEETTRGTDAAEA